MDDPKPVRVWSVGEPDRSIIRVEFDVGTIATVHLFQNISSTFQVHLYGEHNFVDFNFQNSYTMFRANLEAVVEGLRIGHSVLPFDKTYHVIRTVIAGLESMETGKAVLLK